MKTSLLKKLFFTISLLIVDPINSCGITLLHLRNGTHKSTWALQKLRLLLEKQRNRGQDGAGIAVLTENGFQQKRALGKEGINTVFSEIMNSPEAIKTFSGTTYLGHLRYGTHSGHDLDLCQPLLYEETLALAGNFNMTNIPSITKQIQTYDPSMSDHCSDTKVILKTIAYEIEKLTKTIPLTLAHALFNATSQWDGAYCFAGSLDNGDFFIIRDPFGIRPGFYYMNDDIFVAASERASLMGTFNIEASEVKEIPPGETLIMHHNQLYQIPLVLENPSPCSFERIYFSRGEDPCIYQERKNLGKELAERVFNAIDEDLRNAIFCYIPNTSKTAFNGLVQQLEIISRQKTMHRLSAKLLAGTLKEYDLDSLINPRVRVEDLLTKNQKLRTFITEQKSRKELVEHIYSITKGVVKPTETIVALDDSVVRGVTLETSIMKQLISLNPRRIIIVSSAPLILYPDSYGIDMSRIGNLIGYRAMIKLLKEKGKEDLLEKIYDQCESQMDFPDNKMKNYVQQLYNHVTQEEIEHKISEMIRPKDSDWKGEIRVIYQSIEGLHKAIPHHSGDWYFSGNYPTPGGVRVLNTSYMNWWNGVTTRAY